jgi:hypothetical protein
MNRIPSHHYLHRRRWKLVAHEPLTLFINRHYDYQVTLNQKVLDELDVFGSITIKELINGALRRSPQKVRRAPRAIQREMRKIRQYPEIYMLINPITSQAYWRDIRDWFDREVGCGALAYKLMLVLIKRYPVAAKKSIGNGLQLIRPNAFFHKAMVVAPNVTALDPLIQAARSDGFCIEVTMG